jgi:hypothetical protein
MSFTAWVEDLFGEEWQRIRRAYLSVQALKDVPLEKLKDISEGNAYQISRLAEHGIEPKTWLKKAIKLKNEEFRQQTEKLIRKKIGINDPMVKLSEAFGVEMVPESLCEKIHQVMELAARIEEADLKTTAGKLTALEAIVSEYETTTALENEFRAVGLLKQRAEA